MPVESDGISYEIDDVVLHPQYNHQAYNDVAVIKLKPSESKQNYFKETLPLKFIHSIICSSLKITAIGTKIPPFTMKIDNIRNESSSWSLNFAIVLSISLLLSSPFSAFVC